MAYLADAEREDEVVERSLAVVTAVAGSDLAVLLLESEDGWIAGGTLSGAPLPRPLAARLKRAAARWSVAGSRPGPLRGFASTSVHELRVGGARLGYLVAASGSAVEPDGPAADLLDLLARQASAALLAVRLAAEQAVRGEVLRAVQSRLDEALWERNRHLEIHEQLTAAAVESERSGAVAQALHRILGVPVVVEDAEGALLAVEGGSGGSPGAWSRWRSRGGIHPGDWRSSTEASWSASASGSWNRPRAARGSRGRRTFGSRCPSRLRERSRRGATDR